MKYYTTDQNENWLEAQNVQICKTAIMWSKKYIIFCYLQHFYELDF